MLDIEDSWKITELQEHWSLTTCWHSTVKWWWDLVFFHKLKTFNFGCVGAQDMLDCAIYPGSEMIADLGQQMVLESIQKKWNYDF